MRHAQFFEAEGCKMVEMACEDHDRIAASTQACAPSLCTRSLQNGNCPVCGCMKSVACFYESCILCRLHS